MAADSVTQKQTRTPLIAGNWKMNLDHLQSIAFVQKLAWTLKDAQHDVGSAEVAVFPPFTDLRSVQTLVNADDLPIAFGGQDISAHDSGAYTGEISGAFLKALDTTYVIIGHSERRQYHAETDEVIAAKVAAAHRHGIVPIICVGETADDLEQHGPSAVPVAQLRIALEGAAKGSPIVVAYDEVAEATRILYGGSVKSSNIAGFMREADVDGALVGGASLLLEEFASIVRFQKHVGT
jgi:triosephosphate isomerase